MKLLLKSLSLKNFKGVTSFKLTCEKNEVKVYGANASGKTTLADAFTWLLFDKDSRDRSKFSIQPLDKENNIIHNLETEVEAAFLKDGQYLTLCKKLAEKWTRPRGQEEKILSGTEVTRYIDGVPVKETEYKTFIAEIVNQAVFKLISNPYGFENEKWQFKRELLFNVCGSVEDSNIPEWEQLKNYLGDKSLESFKKMVAEQKKVLKKDLEKIPPKIDENNRSLGDEIDVYSVERVLQIKEEHLKELTEKLEVGQKQFDLIREKQKEILSLEQTKENMIRQATIEAKKSSYAIKDKLNSKMSELTSIQSKQARLNSKIDSAKDSITLYIADKEKLYEEFDTVDAESFDEHKRTCPTCNQELPGDKVQELIQNFETEKDKRLDAITNKGITINTRIAENEKIIVNASAELEDLKAEAMQLKKEIEDISALPTELAVPEVDTAVIDAQIDVISKEIESFKDVDNTKLQEKIKEVQGDIGIRKLKLAQAEKQEQIKARIKELGEEQKVLASKLAECEKQEFLIEEFTRSKVEMLEDNINSKFKNVKFKLFNTLVNGGIEECCESLVGGVPFSGANTAGQYAAGIEIINALCKHYDFYTPIWLDGRESVTDIPATESQVINLTVNKYYDKISEQTEEMAYREEIADLIMRGELEKVKHILSESDKELRVE